MKKNFELLIIDAQGGGIGRQLISSILQALPDAEKLPPSVLSAGLKAQTLGTLFLMGKI